MVAQASLAFAHDVIVARAEYGFHDETCQVQQRIRHANVPVVDDTRSAVWQAGEMRLQHARQITRDSHAPALKRFDIGRARDNAEWRGESCDGAGLHPT